MHAKNAGIRDMRTAALLLESGAVEMTFQKVSKLGSFRLCSVSATSKHIITRVFRGGKGGPKRK